MGGAQPPSSGGYGDIDESAQQVGESDAPDVKEQEPRALEVLSGMTPAAAVRPDEQGPSDEELESVGMEPRGDQPAPATTPPDVSIDDVEPD